MKKLFPIIFLSLVLFLIPGTALGWCPYTPIMAEHDAADILGLRAFFEVATRVINAIIFCLVPPIATLMLIIGGVILLLSGGSPETSSLGKKIIFATIVGMVLVYGSWLIINTLLSALGYRGEWTDIF